MHRKHNIFRILNILILITNYGKAIRTIPTHTLQTASLASRRIVSLMS